MSNSVLDMRADEMASLREKNRRLRRRLAEAESIACENDAAVAMSHRLALLLITKENGWQKKAEVIVRRGWNASAAHLHLFAKPASALSASDKQLAAKLSRMPAGGCQTDSPLLSGKGGAKADKSDKAGKYATYYHLPIKDGRRVLGVLTLSFRKKDAFIKDGADDFCRRIAALLSAAA